MPSVIGRRLATRARPKGGQSLYFKDPDGHSMELKTSDWIEVRFRQ